MKNIQRRYDAIMRNRKKRADRESDRKVVAELDMLIAEIRVARQQLDNVAEREALMKRASALIIKLNLAKEFNVINFADEEEGNDADYMEIEYDSEFEEIEGDDSEFEEIEGDDADLLENESDGRYEAYRQRLENDQRLENERDETDQIDHRLNLDQPEDWKGWAEARANGVNIAGDCASSNALAQGMREEGDRKKLILPTNCRWSDDGQKIIEETPQTEDEDTQTSENSQLKTKKDSVKDEDTQTSENSQLKTKKDSVKDEEFKTKLRGKIWPPTTRKKTRTELKQERAQQRRDLKDNKKEIDKNLELELEKLENVKSSQSDDEVHLRMKRAPVENVKNSQSDDEVHLRMKRAPGRKNARATRAQVKRLKEERLQENRRYLKQQRWIIDYRNDADFTAKFPYRRRDSEEVRMLIWLKKQHGDLLIVNEERSKEKMTGRTRESMKYLYDLAVDNGLKMTWELRLFIMNVGHKAGLIDEPLKDLSQAKLKALSAERGNIRYLEMSKLFQEISGTDFDECNTWRAQCAHGCIDNAPVDEHGQADPTPGIEELPSGFGCFCFEGYEPDLELAWDGSHTSQCKAKKPKKASKCRKDTCGGRCSSAVLGGHNCHADKGMTLAKDLKTQIWTGSYLCAFRDATFNAVKNTITYLMVNEEDLGDEDYIAETRVDQRFGKTLDKKSRRGNRMCAFVEKWLTKTLQDISITNQKAAERRREGLPAVEKSKDHDCHGACSDIRGKMYKHAQRTVTQIQEKWLPTGTLRTVKKVRREKYPALSSRSCTCRANKLWGGDSGSAGSWHNFYRAPMAKGSAAARRSYRKSDLQRARRHRASDAPSTPTKKPVTKPVKKTVAAPVTKPGTESVTVPVTEPAPVTKPGTESVTVPVTEPVTKPDILSTSGAPVTGTTGVPETDQSFLDRLSHFLWEVKKESEEGTTDVPETDVPETEQSILDWFRYKILGPKEPEEEQSYAEWFKHKLWAGNDPEKVKEYITNFVPKTEEERSYWQRLKSGVMSIFPDYADESKPFNLNLKEGEAPPNVDPALFHTGDRICLPVPEDCLEDDKLPDWEKVLTDVRLYYKNRIKHRNDGKKFHRKVICDFRDEDGDSVRTGGLGLGGDEDMFIINSCEDLPYGGDYINNKLNQKSVFCFDSPSNCLQSADLFLP
eukprot:GHVQ01017231.1.p1 GENE.GHVQ01017231.1~~GHVQ01017231.1.p1  ORF type:complete len:1267 (+),score=180.17 GHVQ01017231.1:331-3801(+)